MSKTVRWCVNTFSKKKIFFFFLNKIRLYVAIIQNRSNISSNTATKVGHMWLEVIKLHLSAVTVMAG